MIDKSLLKGMTDFSVGVNPKLETEPDAYPYAVVIEFGPHGLEAVRAWTFALLEVEPASENRDTGKGAP